MAARLGSREAGWISPVTDAGVKALLAAIPVFIAGPEKEATRPLGPSFYKAMRSPHFRKRISEIEGG